jgi:hypothetical protein
LRAGLATSAADGGASDRAIMRQTGHRSSAMVNRYVRERRLFRDNATLLAGLWPYFTVSEAPGLSNT